MKKITYNGESKILIALCNSINEIIDNLEHAGDGDMKKSVYDTNGDGIVDNAEKVNNHSVNANVPEDAKFTDSNTTYTLGKSDGKITLTDSDGLKQEVDVPSTDTNTTYTMTLDGSKLTLTDSNGNAQNVTLPSGGGGGGTGMDWTLLKTVTGTTEVSLDGVDFDEICVVVKYTRDDGKVFSWRGYALKDSLTSTAEYYYINGGFYSMSSEAGCRIYISNSSVALNLLWLYTESVINSAIMSVYYGKKSSNETLSVKATQLDIQNSKQTAIAFMIQYGKLVYIQLQFKPSNATSGVRVSLCKGLPKPINMAEPTSPNPEQGFFGSLGGLGGSWSYNRHGDLYISVDGELYVIFRVADTANWLSGNLIYFTDD